MFGNLAHLIPPPPLKAYGPPKDVPPPTPVHFPRCLPEAARSHSAESEPGLQSLPALLQTLVRPADQVEIGHLEALGVHVTPDVPLAQLVPDPSYLPDFARWESLTQEEVHAVDGESRSVLCNGRLSPGASKYLDLQQCLLTANDRAFRSVRRVAPKPGEQYVRLGYCHDFFRSLEVLTGYWDDTSARAPAGGGGGVAGDTPDSEGVVAFYRTSAGSSMPAQHRTQLLSSFLKLVIYDFSCNLTTRQEPRLYVKTLSPDYRHSSFSSGCSFIYRTPCDRESAKRSIVEGPIAAVSPRHTTVFPPTGRDRDSVIDLSREVIAALITAQQRAREGRQEERIGQDAWWATRPRWGGGPGGPIGKEAEHLETRDTSALLVGDKDERPTKGPVEGDMGPSTTGKHSSPSLASGRSSSSSSRTSERSSSSTLQPPNPKRPRKGLAIYDAYRMVRPPAMQWDPKTRYTAIGRQRGTDYDDVFVISSLFHHMSILRVRVPDRLLEVLSSSEPDPGVSGRGRVEVWRTRWFDFFIAQDRVEAMRAVWVVMAYTMRKSQDDEIGDNEGDIKALKGSEAKKEGSRG